MKLALLVVLLPVTGTAFADGSFIDRAKRAKLVEDSPEGQAYQQELWSHVGDYTAAVMQRCFPNESEVDTDSFTLVADVSPSGHLSNVELEPSTPMSRCFAKNFSQAPFPVPAASFGEAGIPIIINMKIKP